MRSRRTVAFRDGAAVFATWLFRDITQQRLGNRNPFTNIGVVYCGSTDDNALNAGVLRYAADPAAATRSLRAAATAGTVR